MNRLDDPESRTVDVDALLDLIYRIQAGLKILVDQLARERNPDLSDASVHALIWMYSTLEAHTPSLTRH